MSEKVDTYRGFEIFADKRLGGGMGPKISRYECIAHEQKIHDESLDGIKRQIDEIIEAWRR